MELINVTDARLIMLPCGGYCMHDEREGAVWIPAFLGRLGPTLRAAYEKTRCRRIIFSCVLNPNRLRKHLRNIKEEWIEDSEDGESHCIEIRYEETK